MLGRRVCVGAFIAALCATAAAAQDVIAQRKALMRAQGAATAPIGRMINGAEPFDLAKIHAALDAYLTTTRSFKTLFPDGSDQSPCRNCS